MADLIRDNWHLLSGIFVLGGYAVVIQMLRRETRNLWRRFDDLRDWQEDHQKDANAIRLQIEGDLGKLREANARTDEKFLAIMATLAEIRADLAHLRGRG